MPKYNCCVPNCNRSHRNSTPDLKFYCIPKDEKLRKTYRIILKNDNLKIDSRETRICSSHWENGEKLSRTHLPTIFPWTREITKRREINKVVIEETSAFKTRNGKRKADEIDDQRPAPNEGTDAVDAPDVIQQEIISSEENIRALKEENVALRIELQEARKASEKGSEDICALKEENVTLRIDL